MAVLIPAFGSCRFDSTGERRLAERLEQKLDDDYLLWHNVPIGPKQTHPDFVIIHPRRGALILETKDWHLETIRSATRQRFDIAPDGIPKTVINPLAQARHCAIQVIDALQRDKQLIHAEGPHQGKLIFPWGHGVVFTRITRRQFDAAGLGEAIEPHLVICQDEMLESVEPEAFQQRLWDMFPHAFGKVLSLPQLDRVRWIMFPEVRVVSQGGLFDNDASVEAELPDIMRVMDLQQEQLARSLGDGHRVIHGVAGSGKTMILGYRALQLAQAAAAKPVLVLCYNEPLAVKLAAMMDAKGLQDRVHVRNFHKWCRQQLVAYGQPVPPQGPRMFDKMVENVIQAVDRKQVPSGQYMAVLIDEGHDFQPEWFKLVVQMVDPTTNSLLVLYDSAQSIYEKAGKKRGFSFKSLGIQAQGRTTILKINYRNTRQILDLASKVAAGVLQPDAADEDGTPLLHPISCGRDGQAPMVIRLPSVKDELRTIRELLTNAHAEGHAWGDMAVLCRRHEMMDECARELARNGVPHQVRHRSGDFRPLDDTVKVMTMHASKGLEFPVVALPGVGQLPEANEDAQEEARVFYVAATRATHRLIVTASGTGAFGEMLSPP
ncbi:AAA family ATPase [Caenimonas sedimenti]|uniref:DNA 3'-5' helicase II n=1 Tax=Caenimonas sedimenti TaxID=2596921 RepID=A0A562ZRG4_9BURK|nr:3'-5' exonuclease [Caenimonas sedimenti]TWO71123.1 AAA family ATPase [Caenimonas sedimenti]